MTIKKVIEIYSKRLKQITNIPQKEVEILILHILKKDHIWLHLNYEREFEQLSKLGKLIKKREEDYPLEYITQNVSFYGEEFHIKEGVLIPRPETELLIDKAANILKKYKKVKKVFEIGVGSGVIGIMLAKMFSNIEITGVDINNKALELAKKNAKKHGVLSKIRFFKSDLFENITEDFDMVISNPPYISKNYALPKNVLFEPSNALFGGKTGDELLKKIIAQTHKRKIPYLLCEIGYDQKENLNNYLKKFSTKSIEFYKDYEKLDRGFIVEFANKNNLQ